MIMFWVIPDLHAWRLIKNTKEFSLQIDQETFFSMMSRVYVSHNYPFVLFFSEYIAVFPSNFAYIDNSWKRNHQKLGI